MKRTLSLVMVAAMLLSAMMFAPAISAEPGVHTLDANNVGITARHFTGGFSVSQLGGKITNVAVGAALPVKPDNGGAHLSLDGTVTAAEWGDPVLSISSDNAATMGSKLPSAENTYYYHTAEGVEMYNSAFPLSYDLWLMWDADYLYVAAVVDDPDGPLQGQNGENLWNGDCLQLRVDPQGPNSISGGTGYNYAEHGFPWAGSERPSPWNETYGKIANLGFAFTNMGKYTECWDFSRHYNVHEEEYLDSENLPAIRTVYDQADANGVDIVNWALKSADVANPYGSSYAAVVPKAAPTADNYTAFQTTYEIAIEWSLIAGDVEGFTAAAGAELGMSLALLNGGMGASNYNSYLMWGSGICNSQQQTDPVTCGGSNSLILSADEFTTYTKCAHFTNEALFAAADCTQPFTCTVCGYEKGFATGHSYVTTAAVAPKVNYDGYITSLCTVCGDEVTTLLAAGNANVVGEYNQSSTGLPSKLSGLLIQYVDSDTGLPINDEFGNPLVDELGNPLNTLQTYDGYKVIDYSRYNETTYFTMDSIDPSYIVRTDILFTGFDPINTNDEDYMNGFYNCFGAATTADFSAGFFNAAGTEDDDPNTEVGRFRIYESPSAQLSIDSTKYIAESEDFTLKLNEWYEYVFLFDDDANVAMIIVNGEIVCAAWNPEFHIGADCAPIWRKFGSQFVMKNLAVGSTTILTDVAVTISDANLLTNDTVVPSSGAGAAGAGAYMRGDSVSVTANAPKSGYAFWKWTSDSPVTFESETSETTTFTAPFSANVGLTANYIMCGDISKDGKRNSSDIITLRLFVAGDSSVNADVTSDSYKESSADYNRDGKINATDILALRNAVAG